MLIWPLPALLAWALAWAVVWTLPNWGWSPSSAVLAGLLVSAGLALTQGPRWRRLMVAGGFPLSWLLLQGGGATAAWVWLLPLAVLAVLYPRSTWQDAPLFPTPQQALSGLGAALKLPPGAAVLEAGCGLGHGLRALHLELPEAQLHGLEWSWPLSWACRLRCRYAQVRRGDIWAEDWSAYQAVYVFQRPESMPRAWAKAQAEMAPGAWLLSLAFEVPGQRPEAVLENVPGKAVWMYRITGRPPAHCGSHTP